MHELIAVAPPAAEMAVRPQAPRPRRGMGERQRPAPLSARLRPAAGPSCPPTSR